MESHPREYVTLDHKTSHVSRSTQEQGNAETRNFIETLNFNINKTVNAGDKYINTMTLIQHTEAGKHRVFKGETKLDNH